MASANPNNPNSNDSRPLRLTLRTLLAWLDDTLQPGEVRHIGNQVTESPFARDLVDRIHKVTRRRRLTVPGTTGPDATDPNVVAMYLDNELPAEGVADFEKRCLTSDVHLAEVASCHQILSMLGQKARVPAEARHRMYRLVKGREAVGRATPRALASDPEEAARTPVWGEADEAPSRPWWSRFAVPAGVAALIALMGVSAYRLAPVRRAPQVLPVAMRPPEPLAAARPAVAPEPAPAEPEPAPAEAATPEPPAEPAPAPAAPGALATLEPGEAVALRFDPAERAWRRLAEGATLAAGDRVAGLAPFRTRLRLGELPVELVGPAEVVLRPAEPGGGPTLELAHGRVVLRSVPESGVNVRAGGTALKLAATPAPVGLALHAGEDPAAEAAEPGLRIHAAEGELRLTAGASEETLDGPAVITLGPDGRFGRGLAEATPAWVTATEPPQADQLSGSAFAALFREGVPVSRALVEALEDERPELQALAVSALATTDGIELILPVLTREGAPGLRRTAIDALRAYRRRGPDAQATLRAQLDQFNGAEWGATVDSLLAPPAGTATRETYQALVGLLTNADVGVRELAVERLMALSGRDALGYDPDRPEGPGARAWQGLLREGRLAPAGNPNGNPPAAAPAAAPSPVPGRAPAPAPGATPGAVPTPPAPGLLPPGGNANPPQARGAYPTGLPRIAGLRYDRGRLLLPGRGAPASRFRRR